MLPYILWGAVAVGVAALIAWQFLPKLWKTNISTAAVKAADIAAVVGSYTSLTAIRRLDSVEADPKAVEACDYLRGVITAWKRPPTTATITAVNSPSVVPVTFDAATTLARVAALEAALVAKTTSTIPTASATG